MTIVEPSRPQEKPPAEAGPSPGKSARRAAPLPTASAILCPLPAPPPRRPYLRRLLLCAAVAALASVPIVIVGYRLVPPDGPFAVLYQLHDAVWLPLYGHLWTALFPTPALAWTVPAALAGSLALAGYLVGVDPVRVLHRASIRRLAATRYGAGLLARAHRLGLRFGFSGAFLRRVVHDNVHEALDDLREDLRAGPGPQPSPRLWRALQLEVRLDILSSADATVALDRLACMLLALQAAAPSAAVAETLAADLMKIIARERDGERRAILTAITTCALHPATDRRRREETARLDRHLAKQAASTHAAAARLDDVGRAAALRRLPRPTRARIDGGGAAAMLDHYRLMLLAAIAVGVSGGDDAASLRLAIEAIGAVERLAVAGLLAAAPGDDATAASAALAATDARLHAARFADRLSRSRASEAASWEGITQSPPDDRRVDLRIAAARDDNSEEPPA